MKAILSADYPEVSVHRSHHYYRERVLYCGGHIQLEARGLSFVVAAAADWTAAAVDVAASMTADASATVSECDDSASAAYSGSVRALYHPPCASCPNRLARF